MDLDLASTPELIEALSERFEAGLIVLSNEERLNPDSHEAHTRWWGGHYAPLGLLYLAKLDIEDTIAKRRAEMDNG